MAMTGESKNAHVISKVLIRNDKGKILTIRRTKTAPRRPLTWDFPGGVVEWGEDPKDTAVREAREETGQVVQNLKVLEVGTLVERGEYAVTVFYTADMMRGEVSLSYEHDQFRWVTKEEFQELDAPSQFKMVVSGL